MSKYNQTPNKVYVEILGNGYVNYIIDDSEWRCLTFSDKLFMNLKSKKKLAMEKMLTGVIREVCNHSNRRVRKRLARLPELITEYKND